MPFLMALASEKVEAPRRPQLLHPVPQFVSAFQPTIHTLPARYPSYLPLCSLVLERETHIQGRASYILNKPRLLPADRHLPVPSLGKGSCASCLVPCARQAAALGVSYVSRFPVALVEGRRQERSFHFAPQCVVPRCPTAVTYLIRTWLGWPCSDTRILRECSRAL